MSNRATFEVYDNPAVRALRVACLPENVPFLAHQGTAGLKPLLGFAVSLPPVAEPADIDPGAA